MMGELERDKNDKLTYYTIIYERAKYALNVYEDNCDNIDVTVIEAQRHRVEQAKRELESFKQSLNI